MVRLQFSIDLAYDIYGPCDFIFNIEAAQTQCQHIVSESLSLNQQLPTQSWTDPAYGNRLLRMRAVTGPLNVHYEAVVDIAHHTQLPGNLEEMAINDLPADALRYIYPSRYCQSDRLHKLALAEFGHLAPGYQRVHAIQQWVLEHVTFKSGSSGGSTSAVDTLIERAGVCRDFAHLMIALCRALNLPARFVSGIDYGADPAMGPTDFHAYVEVMLSGRWYLFDPSGVSPPMGLLRIGTGRDAADTAFATLFGAVGTYAPSIGIEAVEDHAGGLVLPVRCTEALSTADACTI